jgi:citrate lyase subunit beta / citryl-CoA lyase
MLAKAESLDADEIVVDLEDAVAVDAKDAARDAARAALDAGAFAQPAVRVNPPRTAWCHGDILAMAASADRPLTLVVPKVQSAGDLAFVERLLAGAEAAAGRTNAIGVQAIIETAAGIARLDEIAAASERLETLILGYADLAASFGRTAGATDLDLWLPTQERLLTAARAHDLQAIDGPHLGTVADDAFHASAERARALGFDGKWAIHPAQLAALNEIFQPSDEEIDHARRVIATLESAEDGAVALDGQMLDEALRRSALRVLERAGVQ